MHTQGNIAGSMFFGLLATRVSEFPILPADINSLAINFIIITEIMY